MIRRRTVLRSLTLLSLAVLVASTIPSATAGVPGPDAVLVSVNSRAVAANDDSRAVVITPDGRFALFLSDASNLPGPNGTTLLYVHDLVSARTRLVSRSDDGTPLPVSGDVNDADISADGRYVAFTSGGAVYVRDRRQNATDLASRRAHHALSDAYWPQLSANGRRVAFVGFTTTVDEQPFARDLQRGRTRPLLRDANGDLDFTSWVGPPSISGSGRYIAFETEADVTLPGCGAGEPHIYDWRSRSVSCPVSGWGADGPETVALSRTARFLAWHEFSLRSTDLQAGATFEFDIDDQDGEGISPSWSSNERFLAFVGDDDVFGAYRFDRVTEAAAPVPVPAGFEWCAPAAEALNTSGQRVLVTCYPEDGPSAVVVVAMPA